MSRKILLVILMMVLPGLWSNPDIPLLVSVTSARSEALPTASGMLVYASDFNALALGQTQPFPGAANQDSWFSELAVSPGYGEIQDDITQSGYALHQFTSTNVPELAATIDKRLISPPNLTIHPLITLEVDFYAHTSDLSAMNAYDTVLVLFDSTHPGFEVVGFSLYAGNGITKEASGVIISLNTFNGINNNEPFSVSIGQNLAWDTWHHLTLVANHATDQYVSLTVNGAMEDLSAYALPRSEVSSGVWERGQLIDQILLQLAPHVEFDDATDDDIYWDNLRITVQGGFQVYIPVLVR